MRKKSEVGERLSHEIKLRKSHTSLASDSRISNEQKDTTPQMYQLFRRSPLDNHNIMMGLSSREFPDPPPIIHAKITPFPLS